MCGGRSLTLLQNGAGGVRPSWHERFCASPDVQNGARSHQTVVPVLDTEIGGPDFITMAGPCSVETEFQLLATPTTFALQVRASCVAAPSSRAVSPTPFKDTASKDSRCWPALARRAAFPS